MASSLDGGFTFDVGTAFTRSTTSNSSVFTDPASGDLRPLPFSPIVDYCDDSLSPGAHPDLDGIPRGIDEPAIGNLFGPFDIGAYEADTPYFADGFENGTTSAWQ